MITNSVKYKDILSAINKIETMDNIIEINLLECSMMTNDITHYLYEYKRTRKELYFKDVIFEGLASDGGLYIPSIWPKLDNDLITEFKNMSYQDIAIFKPYIDTSISDDKLKEIIFESYNKFTNDEITPLNKTGNRASA